MCLHAHRCALCLSLQEGKTLFIPGSLVGLLGLAVKKNVIVSWEFVRLVRVQKSSGRSLETLIDADRLAKPGRVASEGEGLAKTGKLSSQASRHALEASEGTTAWS